MSSNRSAVLSCSAMGFTESPWPVFEFLDRRSKRQRPAGQFCQMPCAAGLRRKERKIFSPPREEQDEDIKNRRSDRAVYQEKNLMDNSRELERLLRKAKKVGKALKRDHLCCHVGGGR